MDECALMDLGWSGVAYTWNHRWTGNVKARLDRAFAKEALLNMFAHVLVREVVAAEYNHCFVMGDLQFRAGNSNMKGPKPFRHEDVWHTHVDYDQLVLDKCQKGACQQGLQCVVHAINTLQNNLSCWRRRNLDY